MEGYSVFGLDCREPDFLDSSVTFLLADIRASEPLVEFFAGAKEVFHCAALSDIEACALDPTTAVEVNIVGTLNALKAAHAGRTERFLLASSLYALSGKGSIYRTTKAASENLVLDFASEYDLPYTILRFGSLYGTGSNPDNAIRRILTQAVTTGRIQYWGNGSEVREFIHVRDAARLAVVAKESRFRNTVLHLVGSEKLTTRQLLSMVNEIMGGELKISYDAEPVKGRYHMTPYTFVSRSNTGQRLSNETYIDFGTGLIEMLHEIEAEG
jgi:UDP-glucose 4-epimerase